MSDSPKASAASLTRAPEQEEATYNALKSTQEPKTTVSDWRAKSGQTVSRKHEGQESASQLPPGYHLTEIGDGSGASDTCVAVWMKAALEGQDEVTLLPLSMFDNRCNEEGRYARLSGGVSELPAGKVDRCDATVEGANKTVKE